jgi:hypothetical protein
MVCQLVPQGWAILRRMAMTLTFEYDMDIRPRYWPEPHQALYEVIGRHRAVFASHLAAFSNFSADLAAIPMEMISSDEPYWTNPFFSGLDAIALYGQMAILNPPRYIEIGSGNSTKFVRRAIRDHGLRTRMTSVDREPRAEIDTLCDEVVRTPLEQLDLSLFDRLESGDVLFIDGSHQVLSNSDTTVAFLDILPRVKPGVWVHVHDVFLPWDYPPEWNNRYYAEQYLLACWLLADSPRIQIELANFFVSREPELMKLLDPIYSALPGLQAHGGSFWLRRR